MKIFTSRSYEMIGHRSDRESSVDNSLSAYLDEIGRTPLLSATDEVELAQAIERGREAEARLADEALDGEIRRGLVADAQRGSLARSRFLEANLRLVVSIARRYRGNGVDFLELIQEGNLGLVRAVDKFDWRKGFKFSTYATWWIRQAVAKALTDKARPIRVPARVHDAAVTLDAFNHRFQARSGRSPTLREASDGTGLAVTLIEEAERALDVSSLDHPIGEDGAVVGDFLTTEDDVSTDAGAINAAISAELRRAISRLPERERLIISRRFGFDGDPMTHVEIAEILGVTASRIGQLEKLALCRLRHPAFGLREEDLI